jgi:uncharacterized protein (DUF4415 family)
MKKKPLTNKAGTVRELTGNTLSKRKVGQRGQQKTPTKVPITLRYSREVVNYFKETGAGWQSRMDKVLKEWIKKHPHHNHIA